ncbi:type VI secretion system tip protein TssI/VgrG [Sorangium sp. So ce260]|uniref:type VI secretion system Vgr family protein n=1 Tax=Sorangium sp. So ce260 TaxID=3133291 RepID=UPI003F644986
MMDGTLSHVILAGSGLPGDVRVQSYEAHEAVSLPYAVHIELATSDPSFRIDECLQRRMVLEVGDGQGGVRYYDGLPDRVGFLAYRGGEFFFHMRLRPALAALEHREGSRIFQDKTPIDVVKTILAEAGVDTDVEWRLQQTYAPREFLCQYCETEMNFVHRILEDEGIFYFFLHSPDGHKLVFCDDPAAFAQEEGTPPVVLAPRQGGVAGTQPLIEFRREKMLRATEVVLRDYDFEKPELPPTATTPAPGPWSIRHFQYPGGFTSTAEGSRRSRGRISSLRGDVDVCRGRSRAAGLLCGAPMTVEGANEPFLNGDFVAVELRSRSRSGEDACENEFAAIPKGTPFAAPLRAKKPRIRGIQTAVVTGPANEPQSIHVDKYGRVKVRFLWDRSGKQDDTSSCWLRVSQLGLGGSMVLPRVGWEVSVAFLDGDPDRPIVLGRAYNAETPPPYAQPGAAADSSLKSMATPGGAGHNEIKMSDTAGKQGMSISSQKDLNISSGNDKNETVAVNEDHSVGGNYNLTVGANETTSVSANQSIDVGNALQVKVTGAQSVTVGGNEQAHAKCDYVEKIGGTRDYSVGGNQITISCGVRQNITGAFTREVGAVQANISLASIDDNMLSTFDETVGAVTVQLVRGVAVESVATTKDQTSTAAELHVVPALSTSAKGVKQLIGGVHLRKIGGDFVVQAPRIVLGGGVGKFNAGGSSVNLNGGPVVLKGSKISIDAGAIVKLASNLKIG